MLRGEISNKLAPIVAINFETIFHNKVNHFDKLMGKELEKSFDVRYRQLTCTLYNAGYNVYITSFNDIKKYEDALFGKYLYFTRLETHSSLYALAIDCRMNYTYYIDEVNSTMLLCNSYSLSEFLEKINWQ